MSDKSHVTLEQHQCLVCLNMFDTGNLLMSTRIVNGELEKKFEKYTLSGHGFCPACKKLANDGYIALVEAKAKRPATKHDNGTETIAHGDTERTGRVAWIKRNVAERLMEGETAQMPGYERPMVFVEDGFIAMLKNMMDNGPRDRSRDN